MSPRNAARSLEMRERAKERILRAALELFAERGFESATIAQLAARAGVARGLIGYYFASKEGVVLALHERMAAAWTARVGEELARLPERGAPAETLVTLIDASLSGSDRDGEQEQDGRVGRLLWAIYQQPAVKAVLAAHDVRPFGPTAFVGRWRAAFVELGVRDPDMELRRLVATIHGALHLAIDEPEGFPLAEFAAYLRGVYRELALR